MTSEPLCQPSLYLLAENRTSVKERYSNETIFIEECDVGLGVFARRSIRKGETILTFGGPVIDFAETKRRGPWECMPLQFGPNQYFDTQPPGIFVNHSCHPNAGIRNDRDLVALRDIQPGEEIRFDYSTTMEEQSFTMRCLCGAPNCRHTIADFSMLSEPVQEEYIAQGIVMSFIVKKLRDNSTTVPLARRA
ncbi:MAG TPA: SET domain-containing protein-lysine N-methyltransferase [Clostridia bacterium]|nr:SET domain-containing protein-lysine N-methyltransferase [Clostridia bacterium]